MGRSPVGEVPAERTMRDILNRMNYRLKRIQKGKPLKKTKQTDAIFANIKAVRDQVRDDPETLEIAMDTKAKVALGEYVRGGAIAPMPGIMRLFWGISSRNPPEFAFREA